MKVKAMKARTVAIFMAAAAAILLAACASMQNTEADSRIESSIKNSYVFRTYLQDENITVSSRGGDVTLVGTVSDAWLAWCKGEGRHFAASGSER